MNKEHCANCAEYKRCREDRASWLFVTIGLIATVAMRLVTVLGHVNIAYGQAAWYVAIIGFLVFFLYKFRIDQSRSRLISDQRLMEKLTNGGNLEHSDRAAIGALLCAISSSKDRIMYFVIFSSSVLALLSAVYFDFIR